MRRKKNDKITTKVTKKEFRFIYKDSLRFVLSPRVLPSRQRKVFDFGTKSIMVFRWLQLVGFFGRRLWISVLRTIQPLHFCINFFNHSFCHCYYLCSIICKNVIISEISYEFRFEITLLTRKLYLLSLFILHSAFLKEKNYWESIEVICCQNGKIYVSDNVSHRMVRLWSMQCISIDRKSNSRKFKIFITE